MQFVLGTQDSLAAQVRVDPEGLAVRIRQLLDEDALRCRLGEQARERAEARFLIDRAIEDVVSVLRQARLECDQSGDAVPAALIKLASAFRRYAVDRSDR